MASGVTAVAAARPTRGCPLEVGVHSNQREVAGLDQLARLSGGRPSADISVLVPASGRPPAVAASPATETEAAAVAGRG